MRKRYPNNNFKNSVKTSRELDIALSKTQKVTLYMQTFLKGWGLRGR